jgi:hypothetical protein
MSYDLEGKHGSFQWSGVGWGFVLSIAEDYDWKPARTKAPRGVKASKWKGGYDTNDGQTILTEDAANLADALQRALDDHFQRTEAKRQPARGITVEEREEAIRKLADVASGMSVEYVEHSPKGKRKTSVKKATNPVEGADSFDDLLAAKGMNMDNLQNLLTALYSHPVDDANAPAPESTAPAWYLTDTGRDQILEFIEFCRAGEFRIN